MLSVTKINGRYYVCHDETKQVYFESYAEEWSAQTTVIGLTSVWEEHPEWVKGELNDLFTSDYTSCRPCFVEAAYIEKYGAKCGHCGMSVHNEPTPEGYDCWVDKTGGDGCNASRLGIHGVRE